MGVEYWPFKDEPTGAKIHKNLFYGFGDSGSLAGSFLGYHSRDEAIRAIRQEDYPGDMEIGTTAEQLGDSAVTVLSGQEYVDRLKFIEGNDDISDFGEWSVPPTKVYKRDMGWQGAYVILANSYEEAFESFKYGRTSNTAMELEEFKSRFEEFDITGGIVIETAGDF